ncbi:CRM-domain containing factor CFM3, chloroplastic/mitochondrial-like isoform X1 [Vigna umbellata]|uniref:CRM-domain containing factor CFM3, chloroplastic/mitochondrial-like isoform X1 n=1 Tax=Vigna umbellata TaxID=87088 RepID=UPI001F5EFBE5|nr:CRM-domain containing factor CFM3, chloroplastic/mitochondrial-like isoform X1 [Vigna umbellata]XP_047161978.1 CRM-domain containing factor CFM3, chloroplastic/mitochondrial-like isoform X1 [Vigna umbellata]
MAFSNAYKLSEFSFSALNPPSPPYRSFHKFPFRTLTFASLPTPKSNVSAPWLTKSPSPKKVTESLTADDPIHRATPKQPQNAVERIVLRLRNLGLPSEEEEQQEQQEELPASSTATVTGDERLSELLRREWVRPDVGLVGEDGEDEMMLPWEREEEKVVVVGSGRDEEGLKKRRVTAPSLADLTLEDELLRRLRREGMRVRERVSVPKAGLTQEVMEKIHKRWMKEELVRLKFHEELAKDMRKAHEIVERRTGGLVTWRAGSVMMVYRGIDYQGPDSRKEVNDKKGNDFFVPDVSSGSLLKSEVSNAVSSLEKNDVMEREQEQSKNVTEAEAEYNALLDELGPRFVGWWGTGILPVDADLLPRTVPGYKTPFRLLPTGMRSRLTNAEMTNLRKLAKSLPCHFALGRNRNHQGLACAILKLWEKSLVVKIAVKPGIQNTNNELMSEELKMLTGGTLLLRNKYFIVIYRGKDFVPTSVATVLAEREEMTKQVQDVEDKFRCRAVDAIPSGQGEATAQAGTLAEFYEAQARWGREISPEEREKMVEEAAKAKTAKLVRKIEHKLFLAQTKKHRAERLLAKIEASMVPAGPDYDQETITDEERVMFRKVGLRMKPYLPLGIRGVFDGVVENMHLHWKHRELVKLMTKQKTLAFVEDTARLLEYESGGILVAIEKVSKEFALIYYRGKNYKRPINLRPRNLLTKGKALKRHVAMQRHEALSQHITELEKTIEQLKKELDKPQDLEDEDGASAEEEDLNQIDNISELTLLFGMQSENEDSDGFDDEEESDWLDDGEESDWEDDEDPSFPNS